MGKEHTHTFWLITSLILNGFSIRKKFWKAETESFPTIPSNFMYVEDVEDVEDRSNTHKGCNAMYVEDIEDGKRTYHTFWLITSLILDFQSFGKLKFQPYCMSKHVEDVEDRSNTHKGCNAMYVEDVKDAYKCVRITM